MTVHSSKETHYLVYFKADCLQVSKQTMPCIARWFLILW